MFLGVRNSESSPVLFGGSEILDLLCCFGVRNSESSPVLFGGSEIVNPLLCSRGIRNSDSTPVLLGRSEILNALLCCCRGMRFSHEFSSVFLGNKKE